MIKKIITAGLIGKGTRKRNHGHGSGVDQHGRFPEKAEKRTGGTVPVCGSRRRGGGDVPFSPVLPHPRCSPSPSAPRLVGDVVLSARGRPANQTAPRGGQGRGRRFRWLRRRSRGSPSHQPRLLLAGAVISPAPTRFLFHHFLVSADAGPEPETNPWRSQGIQRRRNIICVGRTSDGLFLASFSLEKVPGQCSLTGTEGGGEKSYPDSCPDRQRGLWEKKASGARFRSHAWP